MRGWHCTLQRLQAKPRVGHWSRWTHHRRLTTGRDTLYRGNLRQPPTAASAGARGRCGARIPLPPLPPPSRTNWTRLVPPSVLTGHVSPRYPFTRRRFWRPCEAATPARCRRRTRTRGARRPARTPCCRSRRCDRPRARSARARGGPRHATAGRGCRSLPRAPRGALSGPGAPSSRAQQAQCPAGACPVSTGGGTRRVQLVREEGRDVSS